MIKRFFYLIALFAGVYLLYSCSESVKADVNDKQATFDEAFYSNLKTTKAILAYPQKELVLTGKVISDPDKTISYAPLVSGLIERTYFSLGDRVKKGQVLLDIRSTELSALQAEQVALEEEYKVATRELKTAQSLYDDNLLSERELLEAQGKVNQIKASMDKIATDRMVFGENKGLGTFSIKSPMDGFIISKNVSAGSPVSAEGEPLFTIADLSTVWIIANVYASNLNFVKEGMEANITSISYPNEIFSGKINTVSQVFDPEDKTLKARIVYSNKDLKFKPEMPVVVSLKKESVEEMVSIPSDAVLFDNDAYFVVINEGEGNFSIRNIQPYDHFNNATYIAEGLKSGEEVVTKNQLLIYSELKGN